jgi:hypothetical protein
MSVTCHSAVAREKSMMERLDDHTQSIKIDLFECVVPGGGVETIVAFIFAISMVNHPLSIA